VFQYPTIFDPDPKDGSFTVAFPDFGYGVTQGKTLAEAEDMASDLLACLMMDRMEKKADFPKPSKLRGKNIRYVSSKAPQNATATLCQALRTSGVRKAELARRLGCRKWQIDRLLSFRNSTRMERIEAAVRALGKRLVVQVRNAA
jgi:antitoxin HicB